MSGACIFTLSNSNPPVSITLMYKIFPRTTKVVFLFPTPPPPPSILPVFCRPWEEEICKGGPRLSAFQKSICTSWLLVLGAQTKPIIITPKEPVIEGAATTPILTYPWPGFVNWPASVSPFRSTVFLPLPPPGVQLLAVVGKTPTTDAYLCWTRCRRSWKLSA